MRSIGIIPARYASSRFPGKPLVDVLGQSMIQRVYERAASVSQLEKVVVATDDERIYKAVEDFGGEVLMTAPTHQSGTDRCLDALEQIDDGYDCVLNIQGDEPFISIEQIQLILSCFDHKETQIATLIKRIENNEELFDPNRPKVIKDKDDFAIYFSRQTIPYLRGPKEESWLDQFDFYKHIGMYAYRKEVLKQITKIPASPLELAEGLEQLRWLENGLKIRTAVTEEESYCIDTPEDLKWIENKFTV